MKKPPPNLLNKYLEHRLENGILDSIIKTSHDVGMSYEEVSSFLGLTSAYRSLRAERALHEGTSQPEEK